MRHGQAASFDNFWVNVVVAIVVIWAVLFVIDGYSVKVDMKSLSYTSEHILAVFFAILMNVIVIYAFTFSPAQLFSRSVLTITYVSFIPLSLVYRRLISSYLLKDLASRYFLVFGATKLASQFYIDYKDSKIAQQIRFVDLSKKNVGHPIKGDSSPLVETVPLDIVNYIKEDCDGIIIVDESIDDKVLGKLINVHFNHVPVMPLEVFYELYMQKVNMEQLSYFWLLEEGFLSVGNNIYDKVKRVIDIILSSVILILMSPLFIIIPIAVIMDSKGNAIFKQNRVGKDNKLFTIYKFRTMQLGSDEGCLYTRQNDTRITRIGALLRKLRLDELPQLWNVLKGDMSVIGPRAEWVKLTERYEHEIPYYNFRHLVKPGITGWAQVNYPYGESVEDTEKKLEYDLYYIRRYSILLDAKIALKTLYVIFNGKGQ